ncbi:MAG: HU family DNA-binding protein [Prevotellaceae bacterium]|jgi:DNA-binding protein HU-beta|nr:HU family DNA-binding protein [Prevotellaceae bacterium]
MNNKELISKMAVRLGATQAETTKKLEALVGVFRKHLTEEKSIHLSAFGAFELKKRAERVAVSPIDKKQMLIPPKMSLVFKPSNALKEKFSQS